MLVTEEPDAGYHAPTLCVCRNHALLLSARAKHWDEIASASEGRGFSFNFVYADRHLSGRKSSSAATNGLFYGFALSGRTSSLVSLATKLP